MNIEKGMLEKSIAAQKSKLDSYQAKNQSLEAELHLSLTDIGRLNRELEDHKTLGAKFRKTIDELIKERDSQSVDLKEEVEILTNNLSSLQNEYEITMASKKQLEQFVNYIKSTDQENRMKNLEKTLTAANEEKSNLQDKIIKLEAKIQQNSKVQQCYR